MKITKDMLMAPGGKKAAATAEKPNNLLQFLLLLSFHG